MSLKQISFENGTDGTAINSTNAPTYGLLGGGSTSLGGGTITIKTAAAGDGTKGIELASVAGATTLTRAAFNSANQQAACSFEFELITGALTTGTGSNFQYFGVRYASGFCLRLNWDASVTKLRVNNANAIVVPGITDYNSAALSTKYRFEIVLNTGADTSSGTGQANLYLLGGTTPIKSWPISPTNLNGPNAITQVELAAQNGAVVRFDSIQLDDGRTTEIGRYVQAASVPPTVSISTADPYQQAGTNVALSGTISDTDGTVSSAVWEYMDDDENGAFTGSWSTLPTTVTGGNTATATATATDNSVPAGVRQYRLTGTDNLGATGSAIITGYIYPASGATVKVRSVTNTGSFSNAGPSPQPTFVAALNDVSPNSGYDSYAESPSAPNGAVFTVIYEPFGPGSINIVTPMQTDQNTPAAIVHAVAKSTSGATTLFDAGNFTLSTTPQPININFDSAGNTAATVAIRKSGIRVDYICTQV